MIPVSVLIVTRNAGAQIADCLRSIGGFGEVIVIDSHSSDRTCAIAGEFGAATVDYRWDGRYPKKRQWCLDTLSLRHDWILFVDADERLTPGLTAEIAALFTEGPAHCGYFIDGQYVVEGRALRHGLRNRKLVLFDKRKVRFPVIGDLGLEGMGEIEGHYQPVPIAPCRLGRLSEPMLHHANDDRAAWLERHRRYARWEAGMNERRAWPRDPVTGRETLKRLFRALPARGWIAFLQSFVLKQGFRDGRAGWRMAMDRKLYYDMVRDADRGSSPGL